MSTYANLNSGNVLKDILKYHSQYNELIDNMERWNIIPDPIMSQNVNDLINDFTLYLNAFDSYMSTLSSTQPYQNVDRRIRDYDKVIRTYLEDIIQYLNYLNSNNIDYVYPKSLSTRYYKDINDRYAGKWVYDYRPDIPGVPAVQLPNRFRRVMNNDISAEQRRLQRYIRTFYREDIQGVRRIIEDIIGLQTISVEIASQYTDTTILIRIANVLKGMTMISKSGFSAHTMMTNSINKIGDTSAYGDVYEANITPTNMHNFSYITKISKISDNDDIISHEYVIGEILNYNVLNRGGHGFQYTYNYLVSTPPAEIEGLIDDVSINAYRVEEQSLLRTNPQVYFQYIPDAESYSEAFNRSIRDPINDIPITVSTFRNDSVRNRALTGSNKIIYLLFLTLNNIRYANEQCGFIHGDLHMSNVMVSYPPNRAVVSQNYNIYNRDNVQQISLYSSATTYIIDFGQSSALRIPMQGGGTNAILSWNPMPIYGYSEDTKIDVYRLVTVMVDRLANLAYRTQNIDVMLNNSFFFRLYLLMYQNSVNDQELTSFIESVYIDIGQRGGQRLNTRIGVLYLPQENVNVDRVYNELYDWMRDNELIPTVTLMRPLLPIPVGTVGSAITDPSYFLALAFCKEVLVKYIPEYNTRQTIIDRLDSIKNRRLSLEGDLYLRIFNRYDRWRNIYGYSPNVEMLLQSMFMLNKVIKYGDIVSLLSRHIESVERNRVMNTLLTHKEEYIQDITNRRTSTVPSKDYQRAIYSIL